jgi:hypothetical protein
MFARQPVRSIGWQLNNSNNLNLDSRGVLLAALPVIAVLRQPTRRSSRRNRRKRNLRHLRSILYFQFHSFQSSVAHSGHAVCHLPPRCWRTRQPNPWAAVHNACNSDRLLIVSSASKRALHTSHTKAVLSPCLSMLMARLEGSRQFASPYLVHG